MQKGGARLRDQAVRLRSLHHALPRPVKAHLHRMGFYRPKFPNGLISDNDKSMIRFENGFEGKETLS